MKILNLGSMNIDNVYSVDEFISPGETKLSKELSLFCGGKGLNQSIAAAKAGNEVWHAGLVGNDGGMLLDKLRNNGVNTDLIYPMPGKCGHAIVQVNSKGQNCILLYGGTNRCLTEKTVDSILDAFGSDGMLLLQNEVNLLPYIIEQAANRGLYVALNAAPLDAAIFECPLEKLSWLIVNEVEGKQLVKCQRDEDIIPVLEKRYPACSVLLTLGSRGAICRTPEKTVRISVCKAPVVDTTAAGDTFTGYFLYGMLNGVCLEDSLVLATVASAICIGRPGASDSIPLKAEVDAAIRSGAFIQPVPERIR